MSAESAIQVYFWTQQLPRDPFCLCDVSQMVAKLPCLAMYFEHKIKSFGKQHSLSAILVNMKYHKGQDTDRMDLHRQRYSSV